MADDKPTITLEPKEGGLKVVTPDEKPKKEVKKDAD